MDASTILAEVFYCMIGIVFILTGTKALKDQETDLVKRYVTAAFWFILAATFMFGPYVPTWVTGLCVVILAILSASKKVVATKSDVPSAMTTHRNAKEFGYKTFIPPVILAIIAVLVATLFDFLGANNAIGISAMIALVVALIIFQVKPSTSIKDGTRLMDATGVTSILPQVLAALGAVFTAAGVGDVIASLVSRVIPDGNLFVATAVYCIAMALFTMIMGNGFAAFSVITVGIGIPFLIAQGANPVVVGALGLTAGYCGTLMTPMAANFNIMPAALLETKNKYAIIKSQVPVAIVMLIIHIVLMYVLAF